MFYWCNNLTKAPELPATNLAPGCYDGMFNTCNKLISAPKLPASNLSESCYASMFCGCNGLTSSPELTATTLVNGCYERMFYHCSKLNTIKIHYEGNFEQQYFNNWVNGVASTGTFYYKGIDKENFGTSAIPLDTNNHWTIESNW